VKVQIECNGAVGGWHFRAGEMKSECVATYYDAIALAKAAGHEIDNSGWKHKLWLMNWQFHQLDGFPTWETEPGERTPAFAKVAHVRGNDMSASSALAEAWDDVAAVDFYQREVSGGEIPWRAEKGETYWSLWWFQTVAERDRFVAWQAAR
jgi:hypothetical protein